MIARLRAHDGARKAFPAGMRRIIARGASIEKPIDSDLRYFSRSCESPRPSPAARRPSEEDEGVTKAEEDEEAVGCSLFHLLAASESGPPAEHIHLSRVEVSDSIDGVWRIVLDSGR